MNKAFVREPDEPDQLRCPHCDVPGVPVRRSAVGHHVADDAADNLGSNVCFCGNARCDVAYFDQHGQQVPADQVLHRTFPKWPEGPVCPCLNLSAEDVEADAARRDRSRVLQALELAQAVDARCETLHPECRSCVPHIQKLYLRHLAGRS